MLSIPLRINSMKIDEETLDKLKLSIPLRINIVIVSSWERSLQRFAFNSIED